MRGKWHFPPSRVNHKKTYIYVQIFQKKCLTLYMFLEKDFLDFVQRRDSNPKKPFLINFLLLSILVKTMEWVWRVFYKFLLFSMCKSVRSVLCSPSEELLLLYDKHQSNIILGDVIPAPLTPPSPPPFPDNQSLISHQKDIQHSAGRQ